MRDDERDPMPSDAPADRRTAQRVEVTWSVDCETEETFVYASISNISAVGIFVRTNEPLAVGTRLTLRFAPPGAPDPFVLDGVVQWVNPVRAFSTNPNPGMGVRFVDLEPSARARLFATIRTIAYVHTTEN